MNTASFLPKLFRWLFTILVVCTAVAVVAVIGLMIADPSLPPDARFGPVKTEFLGHPAEITVQAPAAERSEPVLNVRAVNGAVTITVDKPAGMIALLKRYGLPLMLIYAVFFTALFELLRRLFRNVGRGDSFTPQSVRLVQVIGGSLIVFSLVAGLGEMWLAHAAYDYFAQHTLIAVSGNTAAPAARRTSWHLVRYSVRLGVLLGSSGARAGRSVPPGSRTEARKRPDGVTRHAHQAQSGSRNGEAARQPHRAGRSHRHHAGEPVDPQDQQRRAPSASLRSKRCAASSVVSRESC